MSPQPHNIIMALLLQSLIACLGCDDGKQTASVHLQNGDFSQGMSAWVASPESTGTISVRQRHDSKGSYVRMVNEQGGRTAFVQVCRVSSGLERRFRLRALVRVPAHEATLKFEIEVFIPDEARESKNYGLLAEATSDALSGIEEWREVDVMFRVPQGAQRVSVIGSLEGQGVADVAHVEITPVQDGKSGEGGSGR